MQYINTKASAQEAAISFRQATINGLAAEGGLYMPANIPQLDKEWLAHFAEHDDLDIAYTIMSALVGDSLSASALRRILQETLSFDLPVIHVRDNIHVLELFHGPTLAFKDVGARFMSRCLSEFRSSDTVYVLVATSGDTGSAVAHGFHGVAGVEVSILFPKGMVSPFQQYQMTSLGDNIQAIEVDGTFDDCQALVKQAFRDESLSDMSLSSANSINVARLLPQSLYYALAYKQMLLQNKQDKLVISVPSGNYGNITAGLILKHMGVPIHRFVAANNANDAVYRYLQSGQYAPQNTIATYSNAMDVGAPNNFVRIQHLYDHSYEAIRRDLSAHRYDDQATLEAMTRYYNEHDYLLDPHGSVGIMALEASLQPDEQGIFLATAHPSKFETAVKLAVPSFQMDSVDLTDCSKLEMAADYADFWEYLRGLG